MPIRRCFGRVRWRCRTAAEKPFRTHSFRRLIGPAGRRFEEENGTMSNARDGFDAIGIVVDWIEAGKQGHLGSLLDLYANQATIECCEGGSFKGRSEMENYWRPRLARQGARAFEIDALFPEPEGVSLDYRGMTDGRFAHVFGLTTPGIRLTACAPIKKAE
jgi:hypothetical protein